LLHLLPRLSNFPIVSAIAFESDASFGAGFIGVA
jgi:hypothetical protein